MGGCDDWLEIDVESTETVAGIVTEGMAGTGKYVSLYRVQYKAFEDSQWQEVNGAMEGNDGTDSRKSSFFPDKLSKVARFIRVLPLEWSAAGVGMRVGLLICKESHPCIATEQEE